MSTKGWKATVPLYHGFVLPAQCDSKRDDSFKVMAHEIAFGFVRSGLPAGGLDPKTVEGPTESNAAKMKRAPTCGRI
jgi:hypothetical protein